MQLAISNCTFGHAVGTWSTADAAGSWAAASERHGIAVDIAVESGALDPEAEAYLASAVRPLVMADARFRVDPETAP